MLDLTKAIEPESELLFNWNHSPWYAIAFTTAAGSYHLQLYLGGLGTMTLPDGQKGAVLLNLDEK